MDAVSLLKRSIKKKFVFNYSDKRNIEAIHIGYGISDSYARCMATSIASVCSNNDEAILVFHILADELSTQTIRRVEQLSDNFSVEINLYLIDKTAFESLPTQVHFPASIYYRYILPLILDIPRVLYMDADIICMGSLQELFNISLADKIAAAVPDVEWMNQKRNKALNLHNHRYFNSGVLLFDIKKWNEQNTLEKVIAALIGEPKKFRYPDQDALNVVLTGRIQYLDDKWNHLNVVTEGQKNSILLHFAAHPKPWNIAWPISKVCNEFTKDIYRRYEQLTPWKESPLSLPQNYKEMKVYAKCLLKQGSYIQGLKWYARYIWEKANG